jgi:hypothetical protein
MPGTPKPKQTATGKVITPKPQANRTGKLMTPLQMKKEQLKRNKKPSKDSMGYKRYGSA